MPQGMGPQVVNRRMNAIKTNHPKDMMGPNMGKVLALETISKYGHANAVTANLYGNISESDFLFILIKPTCFLKLFIKIHLKTNV